jgi:hypothetical protein
MQPRTAVSAGAMLRAVNSAGKMKLTSQIFVRSTAQLPREIILGYRKSERDTYAHWPNKKAAIPIANRALPTAAVPFKEKQARQHSCDQLQVRLPDGTQRVTLLGAQYRLRLTRREQFFRNINAVATSTKTPPISTAGAKISLYITRE